jgi:hypothetical protein
MKTIHRAFPVLVACTLLLGGCATVTRGTTQVLTVESMPLGATVSFSNGERCETPCTLKLKRKYPVQVEVCKIGFAPVSTQILSQISGAGGTAMAGNILVGGLIGVGVDAASGATKDLRPNPLSVQLVEAAPGCENPAFPAVPEGGQTPEEYAKSKPKTKRSAAKPASDTDSK